MAGKVLAFCWPIRNEYDARPLAKTWRERGALTALPVVAGKNQPLGFRVWTPGDPMRRGPLDIPTPASGRVVTPDVMLLPMLGWDARGYRLGYGGGFFDRTLAALAPRPIALGVTYECLRLDEFESMDWDQPMDWVVTESTVYRRAKDRLETWSR
jgi:5,10-methenyltetrahydrofolate synthetase